MKVNSRLFLLLALFCFSLTGQTQKTERLFTTDSIVFYGADFSAATLLGDFGNGDGTAMKTKMFPSWNGVLMVEKDRYDVGAALQKRIIIYDFGPVSVRNQKADDARIRSNLQPEAFTPSQIQKLVQAYPKGLRTQGLAFVLIVETLHKPEERAYVHATVFDIASRQILVTQLLTGDASGIGLKSYWANSLRSVLKKIEKESYNGWRQAYGSKPN